MTTRNLVAKAFCFSREIIWAHADHREPRINPNTIGELKAELQKRPNIEVHQAAQELGINLAQVGLHVC